jgi:hypothetical protein
MREFYHINKRRWSPNAIEQVRITINNKGKYEQHKETVITSHYKKNDGDRMALDIVHYLNKKLVMGYAKILEDENAETVWCYCCEKFTPHTVFKPEKVEDNTFYECIDCGCTVDDGEDEIVYPDSKKEI